MTQWSAVSSWYAARTHPHTYPGDHPESGFALVDDAVAALRWTAPPDPGSLELGGGPPLNVLLADRGLPPAEDRVPVLAYGGNRNPATLALKLRHYGYRPPGRGVVLPVLTARLGGLDVVAGGLSSQGYLFADLYGDETTRDSELAVHVLLPDHEQLRVLHESEGVGTGTYDVAVLGGVTLDGPTPAEGTVPVLAYLGRVPVFVSPRLGAPLALAAIRARGRGLPEFDCVGMLAHALEAVDLVAEVGAVVGAGSEQRSVRAVPPVDPLDVAAELMRFLNGQWWYRHHTGSRRLRSCERLEATIVERLRQFSLQAPSHERLAGMGRMLSAETAYRPDQALRLGHALGRSDAPSR